MTQEGYKQVISFLNSHYPYRFKTEDNKALYFGLRSEFGSVSDESVLEVLRIKAGESRNPVDLREVQKRARLLDQHKVDQYRYKLKDYNDHLSQSVEDYNAQPSLFSLFGDPEPRKTYEETTELLRAELNKAISGLPGEFRQANGIKEV